MEKFMRAVIACAALSLLMMNGVAFAQSDIEARLQAADAQAGQKVFRKCRACHTIEEGGPNRHGPNLYGIYDQPVAGAEGFRYSDAMKEYGGEWTPERLDAYLENPRKVVKGTKMVFPGIKDADDRANLIAYMKSQADTPADAGQSGNAQRQQSATAANAEEDFGQLVVADGVEETWYACTGCHSEMIVAQQGKTREGWDEMLEWMVEEQGMPELPPGDREIILDYLARHYNTDRPNFPR
jgi:cytochrome c